jgi:hypothetical protein
MQLDKQKVFQKAIDLSFAMRSVMDQLVAHDATPEGKEARELLEGAMTGAIASLGEAGGGVNG